MLGVAKKIVGFAGVALLASMTLVPTSGAETDGQWLVDGYGHPVEPYIEIPGGRGLLPNLSVEENLRMGAYPIRRDRKAVKAGYERVYATFPRLHERRRQLAGVLSGGEGQMLAIGRALMLQPKLMMIDELSLGLAPLIVQQLVKIVHDINRQGVSIILVEQSANLALSITDHAYFIEKGVIRFDGSSRELLERDDLLRSVFLAAAH